MSTENPTYVQRISRIVAALIGNYYLRRVAMTVFVFFVAASIAFATFRLMPGGPAQMVRAQLIQQVMEGSSGSLSAQEQQQLNTLIEAYVGINPDKPIPIAYYEYMRDAILYQDFGKSIWHKEAVFPFLLEKMPWSIFLSIYGFALGRSSSLLLGAIMAHNEGSRFDSGLTLFSIANRTIPYYVIAILSIVFFAFVWPIFPTGGRVDPNTTPGANLPFIVGVLKHAALPILTTFVAGFGGALAFRGNCVREMGKGYLRVARLRGVSESRLAIRYVGRNALLPVYTSIMMSIASLFGSGIIIETIFNYPAVGFATFNALTHRDYPLLMGAFLFFTGMTLVGVLVADLTYGLIDPRVKGGGERESF